MYLYMLVLRKVFMYVCTQHTIVHTMLPCWMIVSSCVFQVDTEACEQCFSWLSRYARITRRMQRSTFLFFTLYMCDMHNLREESKLRRSHYLYTNTFPSRCTHLNIYILIIVFHCQLYVYVPLLTVARWFLSL